MHDHVRLYSSASPSLKSTKGVLALASGTERIADFANTALDAE